jgi:hypothetical protein
LWNQDGTCGPGNEAANTLNYFVTDLLAASDGYLHVRWDSSQAHAAFYYILNEPLDITHPPRFAWKLGTDGNPAFINGQACDQGVNATLPAPYGTILSDSGGPTITVNANASTVPKVPFAIVSGPSDRKEYMTVTKVQGQTWTVVRGASPSSHVGQYAMSTPMSALAAGVPAPYAAGAPAQMCYVYPPPGGDFTRLYIFDIGDGWVKFPTQ